MTEDLALLALHRAAFGGMAAGPKNLFKALAYQAEDHGGPLPDLGESALRRRLHHAHPDDALLILWRDRLSRWDFADGATPPNTEQRRAATYEALGLAVATRDLLDRRAPFARGSGAVVISEDGWDPWYTEEVARHHSHYWNAYREALLDKRWAPESVTALDRNTTRVVERLADPTCEQPYQSKGLVVGYVQSGKTANFTGVIAKAIDAGYRLVIVLTGTIEALRAQTQRRLDMELVGVENIYYGQDPDSGTLTFRDYDYLDDRDRLDGGFLRHGALPSRLGGFDIVRLTRHQDDYQALRQGLSALEFEKADRFTPLYAPENLHRSSARLMVVKKNASVLKKLVKDLGRIKTERGEIPTLIIDDESDQASVNTSDPRKWTQDQVQRTAINGIISELLGMLPRAQYIGYTATPFANVFIDPADAEDIFPKDFVISLDRPDGYMGVADFHDIDSTIPADERTVANSAGLAHVRSVRPLHDDDDTDLGTAIDMFVLTGAIKLFREDHGLGADHFRHHTMLVHESVKTHVHRDQAAAINAIWRRAGYLGSGAQARLRQLYEQDVRPVSEAHAAGAAIPGSYADIAPYIGIAAMRIEDSIGSPVVVINGDKEIEQRTADFDRQKVWRILVGGAKLSRGFTIEGLTVSYYRRKTLAADTLMQMGRWFGFRKNYRDLVRLYIGRDEGGSNGDLYEAFEAICRDEEEFRDQLRLYAELVDGAPQVTPAQIPPLVTQRLPWLKPTARNKMFNAELVETRSPGLWVERSAYPTKQVDLRHNVERFEPVIAALALERTELAYPVEDRLLRFPTYIGRLGHGRLLSVLRELRWSEPGQFRPDLAYLENPEIAAKIEDWVVIAPQLQTPNLDPVTLHGFGPLDVVSRRRREGKRFTQVSFPPHRYAARRIVGTDPSIGDPVADGLAAPRRGCLLMYPTMEPDQNELVMAFALVPPSTAISADRRLVAFRARDSSRAAAAIVTTPA
ncbi:Z1 domain-containing protein [Embleya sp. NBC_00888]|uniref:Z1 domain-containing protein n=1 Tax=Embleya sp. NBC_00888 TaxID=2975960 RepID=UPI0038682221|nr:Z1 domain-containing protein [Embleya sp. NBC_00888]